MVTLQEQLGLIGARRTELERIEEQVAAREVEIAKFEEELPSPRGRIQEQVSLAGILGAGRVGGEITRRRGVRRVGVERARVARTTLQDVRGQLTAAEQGLLAAESRIAGQQRIEADVLKAQNILLGQDTLIGASGRVRRLVRNIEQVQSATRAKRERSFREEGLTPIFIGGKLAGFESEEAQMSFALQDLPSIQPSAIAPLEKAGIIEVIRDEPGAFDLGVGVAPGLPSLEEFRKQTSVIQPADTSLKTFIEGRNPFTGTFEFFVEKGRGLFGKTEERFAPGGQILAGGVTGERISTGVQIAPLFIPQTAPAFLFGAGVGQFFPGGRREAKGIGVSLEQQIGLPAKVGEIGFLGLAGAGAVVGGFGALRQTEAALGLPKFDVKFLAQQQPIQQVVKVGEETFVSTRGIGEVTRRGLLGERQAITGFESLAKITPGDDLFTFQAATRGIARGFKGIKLPSQKLVFGKPKGFGGLTTGIGREGEQFIVSELPAIGGLARRGVEGFEFIGSTKLFVERGRDFEKFITVGKGFELPSGIVTKSQFGKLERGIEESLRIAKTGRGEIFGLTKKAPVEDIGAGSLILRTRRGDIAKAISEQTAKQVVGQAFPKTPFAPFAGVSTKALGLTKSIEETFPSAVQVGGRATGQFAGLGLFERTEGGLLPPTTRGGQLGFQLPSFRVLQAEGFGLGTGLRAGQLQKLRQQLKELSRLEQPLAQQPRLRAAQREAQRSLQLQRQGARQQFKVPKVADFIAPPFIAGGFGFPSFPRREPRKKKRRVAKRARRGFVSTLAPGFSATILGISGKFPKQFTLGGQPIGLLPSQLRVVPRRRTAKRKKRKR